MRIIASREILNRAFEMIVNAIMDADMISIECLRSQMELLDAFSAFKYPNEIGPDVYDIHSPQVPSDGEIVNLPKKAKTVIPANRLWVNPDCLRKTRHWQETEKALIEMVSATSQMRESMKSSGENLLHKRRINKNFANEYQ